MGRRIVAAVIFLVCTVGTATAARADNLGAAGDISNPPGGFRYQCGELASFQAAYHQSWGGS